MRVTRPRRGAQRRHWGGVRWSRDERGAQSVAIERTGVSSSKSCITREAWSGRKGAMQQIAVATPLLGKETAEGALSLVI